MKKIILALFTLFILLSSCEKWLEEEQVATLSYGYYDTEAGCESLINACYEGLRIKTGDEWSYALFNYGTDEYQKGYEWTQPYAQPEYNDYTPDLDAENKVGYPDIGDYWTLIYNAIDRCNVAVDKINRLNMEEALGMLATQEGKDTRIGEAKFIRAYLYFNLVQQFGSIPFTLQPSSGLEEIWPRTPVSVVYDSIVADMDWALAHVPEEQTQIGRVEKDAVRHFLAKVLLTRSYEFDPAIAADADDFSANYDLGGTTADLQRAAALIDSIEMGGRHQLMEDFASLWLEENEDNMAIINTNTEVIFASQFTASTDLNPYSGSPYKNAMHLYFFNQYENDYVGGMARNLEYGRPFRRLMLTDYAINIHDRLNDSRLRKSLLEVHYINNTDAGAMPTWTKEELGFAFTDVAPDSSWAIRYGDTIRVGERKYEPATTSTIPDRVTLGDTALIFLLNDENTTLTDRDIIATGHIIYARYFWRTDENRNPVELVTYDRNDDLLQFYYLIGEGTNAVEIHTWDRNKSPSLIKYWDRLKPDGVASASGTKDQILARLAESYLLGAEAYGRLGDYAKAVEYINKVRRRAGYAEGEDKTSYWLQYDGGSEADLTASTKDNMEIEVGFWNTDPDELATYPAGVDTDEERFQAFILNERCRELLGELHRWEDLKRMSLLKERAYEFNDDVRNKAALQNFHYLRPIPIIHLDAIKTQDGDVVRPLTSSEKLDYQNYGYIN